ncbi:DNA excision repair protein ERCC-1-like isoform X2 [Neocloeon triangulifer]|uniref:DNA excision repair protein ERCC-1-like isoform X2 n=1 Tax=Neocloeon triangulifer TaxID=2078957 RepID=UPI00286F8A19|nr:DNA excision repair protein ERCC-1-like isoform X2 [Neocloeon triangulifer]
MDPSSSSGSGQLRDVLPNTSKSKFYRPDKLLPTPDSKTEGPSSSSKGPVSFVPLLVNPRQRGNPLLKHVTNVAWQFDDGIAADYVTSRTAGILFLSLCYHNLNPEYIHDRIKNIANNYDLRVLLVQVDFANSEPVLRTLNRICLLAQMTLMLAWSAEQAGKIVETYKMYENKPPDMIMERNDDEPYYQLVKALCCIPSVNRADAITLLSVFGSLEKIVKAPLEQLELCPGIGPAKAERLWRALRKPFLRQGVTQADALRVEEELGVDEEEEDLNDLAN